MDLRKEIKLSDLLPKRRKKTAETEPVEKAPKPERKSRRRRAKAQPKSTSSARTKTRLSARGRKKKFVGLKIGASQIAAARVVNNGGPQVVQTAREELDSGIVVNGEL